MLYVVLQVRYRARVSHLSGDQAAPQSRPAGGGRGLRPPVPHPTRRTHGRLRTLPGRNIAISTCE